MLCAARQHVSQLIQAVIEDRLDPDAALLNWPRISDPSLNTAYQALLHFSADRQGYHQTEVLYADIQLQWLQLLAQHLSTGESLPYHIMAGYTARPVKSWGMLPGWVLTVLHTVFG